jgi:hypothetical protein
MRAEEILAEAWRQICAVRGRGGRPARIVLSPEAYRLVQDYRAGLGSLQDPEMDYISRHSLFTLPVYIEKAAAPRVEEEA